MDKVIKIILSILFFICLADMPYGYFQVVRIAALIGFSILAYSAYERCNNNEMIIYVGLALLFQPFIKIALGRTVWNIVDIIVAIALLASLFVNTKSKEK